MSITLTALMKQRYDTAANWTTANPTLLAGEIGIESDTKKWKLGTGSTAWTSLGYIPGLSISAYPLVNADISATAEIAVSKLADGAARQLLQTDAAGTGVEWASNIDIPGTLDVTGAATFDNNVIIQGDLTVNGTTTTIDTTNLAIEDKNIEIGKVTTPSDVTADGGGITLKATVDKTITWIDATDAWTFSEHVNIASAKEYRINGVKALDATSLGSAVVSSSLTSVGTIGIGVWQGTAIADTYLATIATAGKVSNSATTATDANTASAIVARDASGNFTAGTITAALTGAASSNVLKAGDTMTGALVVPLASAATPSLTFTGDLNTGIYSPGADQVAISTNGTGRLFVGSTGNIGMSEANPTARLHLSGTNTAGGIKIVDSSAASAAPGIEVIGKRNDGNTASAFAGKLLLSKNTTAAAINSTNVLGSVAFGGNHTDGTEANILYSASIVGAADGAFNSATDMPTALVFNTGATGRAPDISGVTTGTERLRITSAGLVGLGTSSPDALLTVNGVGAFGAGTAALPSIARSSDLDTGAWFPGANTIAASTAGVERLRITSGGLVGIGTTSPSSLLHLADAGNITVGTTTGTKIGTATTQKLGFYNATPVVQPAAVANATTAVDVITQLNDLLAKLRTLGIIAT